MSSIFSSTSAVVVYHSLITTQKYIFWQMNAIIHVKFSTV
jgi:hypothetical protein